MNPRNLFEKVWDDHAVRELANGQTQLFIATHLIHEVTSPQAFGMLRERNLPVRYPERTFATVDHIVPTDEDVHDPVAWANDALCLPESRNRFRRLLYLGLTDAYRLFHQEPHKYSFWDYQRGAWQKNFGVRIDHLLLSPLATDRLLNADIDQGPRGKEKPSDHTPVWCKLE